MTLKALIPCILSIGSAFVFYLSLCVFVACVFVSVCIPLFRQYVRQLGVNQVFCVYCALYIVSSFEIFLNKYLLFSFIFFLRAMFIRYIYMLLFFPFSFLYILLLYNIYILLGSICFSFQSNPFFSLFFSLFLLYSYPRYFIFFFFI